MQNMAHMIRDNTMRKTMFTLWINSPLLPPAVLINISCTFGFSTVKCKIWNLAFYTEAHSKLTESFPKLIRTLK